MEVYFIRHGETDWNKEYKIQGSSDIPLNAYGRYLAEETAKGLREVPFAICYSSPLSRALETAQIILAGREVEIRTDRRLAEMAFGEWEGRCCSKEGWELPKRFYNFFLDPEHFVPGAGGEGFPDVKKRTGEFLDWLFAQEEYADKTVLVSTHGSALSGLLNNIKGEPIARWAKYVHRNCGVTKVRVENKIPRILWENKIYYDCENGGWEHDE